MFKFLCRYNFLLALFILLFVPGILLAIKILFGSNKIPEALRADYQLTGVTTLTNNQFKFDFTQFKSHDFQKNIENLIANKMPLRSLFIRMNNQFYYSIFKKSYSEDGGLIIGKSNQLITKHYIEAYCFKPSFDLQELTTWADKIKQLSNFYESQGKTFIYFITPSKAEYMPDKIPKRFHCKNSGISANVENMVPLLEAKKINYINGPELMRTAKQQYQTSMFDRGGIHWNKLGAAVTTNALINTINNDHHFLVNPIKFNYVMLSQASGRSADLLSLLNLLYPNNHYATPQLNYLNDNKIQNHSLKIVMIGGSFLESIYEILIENQTFSEIRYLNYLKMWEMLYQKRQVSINQAVDLTQIISKINAADIIVLEENSELMISNHGQLFYEMMNKYLQDAKNLVSKK